MLQRLGRLRKIVRYRDHAAVIDHRVTRARRFITPTYPCYHAHQYHKYTTENPSEQYLVSLLWLRISNCHEQRLGASRQVSPMLGMYVVKIEYTFPSYISCPNVLAIARYFGKILAKMN